MPGESPPREGMANSVPSKAASRRKGHPQENGRGQRTRHAAEGDAGVPRESSLLICLNVYADGLATVCPSIQSIL